jgi:hypothetical protein
VLAAVPGSAGTRHRVLATLRVALNAAVKQRQITWNPCTGIELEPENPAEGGRWTLPRRPGSSRKNEPEWVLDMRLKGLKYYGRKPRMTSRSARPLSRRSS